MAVRQIKYTVYADRLEPSVRQLGGMQGDHKATEVLFEISGSLYEILKEQAESTNGRLIYRFDGYDGAGGVRSSDTKELPAEDGEELLVKLKYPLEEWITRYGGQMKVVLVISLLKDDSTEMELYSYPAVCQLKNRPFGTPAPGENHESISTLAQVTKESAEIAVRAKDEAIAAQIKAEENAEEVIGRIEPLEADIEELKQSSVSKDYVDSHLEGVSDLVSDNQDDIRNLGERTVALETDVETIKQGYVTLNYIENNYPDAQTVDRRIAEYVDPKTENIPHMEERITYAESDIINLQEDIVIIKEDYATKKYVDDAVASGAVSQEYVDNAIAGVKDIAENNESDIEFVRQKAVSLETEVENLKESSVTKDYVDSTFTTGETVDRRIAEYDLTVQETYATKKYVDDAVASGGGGAGGNIVVDQTYNPESENAQSGKAVAEVVGDIEATLDEIIDIQDILQDGYEGGTGGGVSSWNDLTDKPFYDEHTTLVLDYANPPTASFDLNGIFFGKVTDGLLTADHINGANLSLSFTANATVNNVSQDLNVDTLQVFPFSFGTAYQYNGEEYLAMIAVAEKTGEFDPFGDGNLLTITETGTYLGFVHYSGATPNSMSLEYDFTKTLDIKFIPNELYTEIDQRIEKYIDEALGGEY